MFEKSIHEKFGQMIDENTIFPYTPLKKMISVQEATHTILSHLPTVPQEFCALNEAQQRILRENILADRDLPPFDRAMMDGIAVNFNGIDDQTKPVVCSIEGYQTAGLEPLELKIISNCIEIATGATLPFGTDTVIPVEQLTIKNGSATINPDTALRQGQYIHKQGSDHPKGTVLMEPGIQLSAKEIAVIASAGQTALAVSRLPSVALVSTGDELVPVDQTPLPHQIRQSNANMLAAAIKEKSLGIPHLYHIPDAPEEMIVKISKILNEHDLVVFSGGVSKGMKDFLPQILGKLDVEEKVHWVSQRPGKPLWFGVSSEQKPVFGLPGNPLSTLTCFHRYISLVLRQMLMQKPPFQMEVALLESFRFDPPLTCFLPVKLVNSTAGTQAIPCPANNSGDYAGILQTSGFIEIPAEVSEASIGSKFPFYEW
jgi:molybdopterin molybdotransferase